MMRIGLVCPYDLSKPGGVQAQVLGLANTLPDDEVKVTVLGPGLPDDIAGVDLGATVTIPGNGSMVPLSIDPRVSSDIKKAAGLVDILHVHEPLMPFVSLTALRAGKPVVGTFHASPGALGTGFYSILSSGVKRVLGPNIRKITAVSLTAAKPLPEELQIDIVPNGVDVGAFGIDVPRVPNRVSFLGRDETRKGLDVLLDAWPTVAEKLPDAELVVMNADRGSPGATWKGWVGDAEKAEILASSAVYVAPNLGGESFGVILIEAMAAGTPVVASNLDAFRDVGGDAVRYFETGRADDLAATLVSLLRDDEERSRLSAAGKTRAADFDWSRVTRAYREVYKAALS